MEQIVHNPTDGIYSATGDFVHALEVRGAQRMLFVAGTLGLDAQGVPGETVTEQIDLIWRNIRRILREAGMTVDNIVRLTSYLTKAEYAEENASARIKALNGRAIPTTAIVVQTLVSEWLVEIEVIACG
jgi:enamine deaminase RidA (YjgF/YER057c/UK114 family)